MYLSYLIVKTNPNNLDELNIDIFMIYISFN